MAVTNRSCLLGSGNFSEHVFCCWGSFGGRALISASILPMVLGRKQFEGQVMQE